MRKKIALAIAATILLSGCAGPRIDEGVIRHKDKMPAWVQNITVCSGSNPPICTNTPIFHDESWHFDVWEGGEDDPHGWVQVTEQMYEEYEVGDYWERPMEWRD